MADATQTNGMATTAPQANGSVVNNTPIATPTPSTITNPTTGQQGTAPLTNQSTTTLSSDKTNDIANIQNNTQNLSQTGISTNPDTGITTNANNTVYSPKTTVSNVVNGDGSQTTTYSDGTTSTTAPASSANAITTQGGYYGDQYIAPGGAIPKDQYGNYANVTSLPASASAIIDSFNNLISKNDANTATLLQNIQNQYKDLITAQSSANASATGAANSYAVTGGQGVASASNVIQGTITEGLNAITNLVDKESMAITQAQIAGDNEDYQLQGKINDEIENIRVEKQNAAIKLSDAITAQKQKVQDEQVQASKDAAISAILNPTDGSTPLTDPAQILAKLRANGNTTITLADVTSSLTSIATANGTTPADMQKKIEDAETARHNKVTEQLDAITKDIAEKTYNATYGAFVGADGSTGTSNPSSIPGYTQLPNGTAIINSQNLPTGIDKKSNIGGIPVLPQAEVDKVKTISSLVATAAQLRAEFMKVQTDPSDSSVVSSYQNAANEFNNQISKLSGTADYANLSGLHLPTDVWGGVGRGIANMFQGTPDTQFTNAISGLNSTLTNIIPGYSAPKYGVVFQTPQDAQNYFTSSGMSKEYTSEVAKANTLAQQLYGRPANDGEILQIINGQ